MIQIIDDERCPKLQILWSWNIFKEGRVPKRHTMRSARTQHKEDHAILKKDLIVSILRYKCVNETCRCSWPPNLISTINSGHFFSNQKHMLTKKWEQEGRNYDSITEVQNTKKINPITTHDQMEVKYITYRWSGNIKTIQ